MDVQRDQDQETAGVERSRQAARKLEQVCALAMRLPAREPAALTYPSFRDLLRR